MNGAMKSAKFFSYKEFTLTASAGKSFIKIIKGKRLRIFIENVTEAKFALFYPVAACPTGTPKPSCESNVSGKLMSDYQIGTKN